MLVTISAVGLGYSVLCENVVDNVGPAVHSLCKASTTPRRAIPWAKEGHGARGPGVVLCDREIRQGAAGGRYDDGHNECFLFRGQIMYDERGDGILLTV